MTNVKTPRVSELKAVVIGASAGGVEAINQIFEKIPAGFSLPIVVILHVRAGADFIAGAFRGAPGQVCKEAEDKETLVAGGVYFAPSGYHLLLEPDLTFSLSAEAPIHFARPAIDVFFDSAAYALQRNVLGILLTGANEDGAWGLQRIHTVGGFTIVQSPETANSRAMPEAALKRFEPHRVLSPVDIGRFIGGLR